MQVHFRKSPTGAPFYLAYNKGDFGWVRPQKAEALLKAGVIDPIDIAEPLPAVEYVSSIEIEQPKEDVIDLASYGGVRKHFGQDIDKMREYCENEGIKVNKAVKRPETFWRRIAKHNKK